jgi:hypothetical protein
MSVILNSKRLILGSSLSFCLDGTAITNAAGLLSSGPGIKPDGTTPGDWTPLGTVEKVALKVSENTEEVLAPAPGPYRRVDRLRTSQMTDLSVDIQEVNELVLQSILRTASIADGTAFVPGAALGELRGWFNLTAASQRNRPVLNWQFYAIAVIRLLEAENKTITPGIDFALLYNPLESGLSTLSEC